MYKWFKRKGNLDVHKMLHDRQKVFSCTQCDKCFSHPLNLKSHMRLHNAKFKCPECGKCCRANQDLTIHRRIHSGEKPFECTVCSKRFATKCQLVTHSRLQWRETVQMSRVSEGLQNIWSSLQAHRSAHDR